MKNFVNHRAEVSLMLAAVVALITSVASFDFTQNKSRALGRE